MTLTPDDLALLRVREAEARTLISDAIPPHAAWCDKARRWLCGDPVLDRVVPVPKAVLDAVCRLAKLATDRHVGGPGKLSLIHISEPTRH